MGDSSAGSVPPGQRGGGGITPKGARICEAANCQNPVPSGSGNYRYCSTQCKNSLKKEKRKSTVLSPADSERLPKTFKDDELQAALAGDDSAFLELEKEEMLSQFQTLFKVLLADNTDLSSENKQLAQEVASLKSELDRVKIVLADKVVELFQSAPAPAMIAKHNFSKSKVPSFAEAVKVVRKPVLIARVGGLNCQSMDQITDAKIDELLDLKGDGPVVQNIKKIDGRVVLSFRDVASRDKAREMIDKNPSQNLFHSVSVPQKQFPAIVRFQDLDGVEILKGPDKKVVRESQEHNLMVRIMDENPTMRGPLESLRVLHQRPNSKSFLVRIAFSSKSFRDRLLESGRILLDGKTHAVVEADPAKEVRHCTRCKRYGHTQNFCKAKAEVCGKCAQEHATSSCTMNTSDYKCINCHQSHQVGSPSCPALAKAVSQYLSYISAD